MIPHNLKEQDKKRFKEHQFSVVANELMSMNRTMPDVRYPEYVRLLTFFSVANAEFLPIISFFFVISQMSICKISKEITSSIDSHRLSQ